MKTQEGLQLIGGKNGSKSHIVTDVNGIPLAVTVTSGSVHDSREIGNVLKARKVKCKQGKKKKLTADKVYKGEFCITESKKNNVILEITGKNRQAVKRTHEHFKRFRKLVIRYEKNVNNYLGLFKLATAIIVFRKVVTI